MHHRNIVTDNDTLSSWSGSKYDDGRKRSQKRIDAIRMNLSKYKCFPTVVSSLALLLSVAVTANAQTIDDHFDDGNLGTDSDGPGTGFTVYQSASSYYGESGTEGWVKGDGANRGSIESKESVDATGSNPVSFIFEGIRFAQNSTPASPHGGRHQIGVRMKEPAGYTYRASDLGHGFYVQCEHHDYNGNWSGISRFWYINEANAETVLAAWEFDTLDLLYTDLDGDDVDYTPVLDITITLTTNAWALEITGDTKGAGSLIKFSGTNTFGGDNDHGVTNGHAYMYNQTDGPGTYIYCDRILITNGVFTPPLVDALLPADDSTTNTPPWVMVTFSEDITLNTGGSITITNITAGTADIINVGSTQLVVNGPDLVITPTNAFSDYTDYAVLISTNAVMNFPGAIFAGITNVTTWNFTTTVPDTTNPTLVPPTVPADNTTNVYATNSLVATFSENIAAGSGNIVITNLTDSTVIIIDVTDTNQVTTGGKTLTISPTNDLRGGAMHYAVLIDSGAIEDYPAGNPFAGITSSSVWDFWTSAAAIDDHFDDGNITTDSDGPGTGFVNNGGSESSSHASVLGNGATRRAIASKEWLDATGSAPVTFLFQGVYFELGPDGSPYGSRLYLGVRQASTADVGLNSAATLKHGFYVEIEDDDYVDQRSGISRFFYINESNVETNLATWEFSTIDHVEAALDGTGTTSGNGAGLVLDITITLTSNTWDLAITGDTQVAGGGSPISFSGTNSFGGDDDHGVSTGHAFVHNQSDGPYSTVYIDRILTRSEATVPSSTANANGTVFIFR